MARAGVGLLIGAAIGFVMFEVSALVVAAPYLD
jgi:hypothetical protein